jgi:hypothetical protein
MIPTMMMINMSTDGSAAAPLRLPLTTTNHPSSSHPDNTVYGRWEANVAMRYVSSSSMQSVVLNLLGIWMRIIG